jgi:group I intron endonuclease
MVTGVYTITNTKTGMIYVGSTKRTFKKRQQEHFSTLEKGIHYNSHLQKSFNKYGKSYFKFEVLEECLPDYCLGAELYWINMLDTYLNGYNMQSYPIGTIHHKHTKATRKKMSDKAKARSNSHLHTQDVWDTISKRAKERIANGWTTTGRTGTGKYGKCEQYDLDGNYIKTYDTVYDAFKSLDLKNASHIIRASQSFERRSCSNFKWKVYTLDDEWFK